MSVLLDKPVSSAERPARAGIPPSVATAIVWLAAMLIVAIFADWLAPYDFAALDLKSRLVPPIWTGIGSWAHPLGTDDLGRDMLSRAIQSVRISMLVAILGTMIGGVLGTVLGLSAAHFRGWVDEAIMMLVDFQSAIPFIILSLAVLAFFGNSMVLFICVIGLHGWERYARIVRGLSLSASAQGYAVAIRTLGASPTRLYLRHILPNIGSAVLVNLTLNFPATILLETSLSFLGLGIRPMTSLGNMVGFGRDYLLTAPWIAGVPCAVIFLTTLAFCLVGDWLRDRFDPALRGR